MFRRCWIGALVVTIVFLSALHRTEARPSYLRVFVETYETHYAGKNINIQTCTVCHVAPHTEKYRPNNYADAVAESLRRRNATDDVLIKALREAEDKPSAIEGKTFGDLIREGALPASR